MEGVVEQAPPMPGSRWPDGSVSAARASLAAVLVRHRVFGLVCGSLFGCQAAASPSPVSVEVTPPAPASATSVLPPKRALARVVPKPCPPHYSRFPCDIFGGCEPRGVTTKERECWVKVTFGVDLPQNYDMPCFLLGAADWVEQLATMESERASRVGLTTPGLAAAVQRHVDAQMERVLAARALAKAVLEENDSSVIAGARARVDTANALEREAWGKLLAVCDPY
jgi:hypothetical protein